MFCLKKKKDFITKCKLLRILMLIKLKFMTLFILFYVMEKMYQILRI